MDPLMTQLFAVRATQQLVRSAEPQAPVVPDRPARRSVREWWRTRLELRRRARSRAVARPVVHRATAGGDRAGEPCSEPC